MVKNFMVGVFSDEQKMLKTVCALRGVGFQIHDVFTPYVVHGLDDAMGLRRSRLGIVTFLAGLTGLALAMALQFWTAVFDWRINVGGKPDNSTLAFLPVAFEITVLIAGLATALTFFLRSQLFPGSKLRIFNRHITDHLFAVVLEMRDASINPDRAKKIFWDMGVLEVREESVNT